MHKARVLEIGYQSGGFAVPMIAAMSKLPGFEYIGVDDCSYSNAVNPKVIAEYLRSEGITEVYQFLQADADQFLRSYTGAPFDLVLIDHAKPLYPRECRTLLRRHMLSPRGYMLFHDVLAKASLSWLRCASICRAYGYAWDIANQVPGGLAVVSKSPDAHDRMREPLIALTEAAHLGQEALLLVSRILAASGVSRHPLDIGYQNAPVETVASSSRDSPSPRDRRIDSA
jgi:CheY-like chemotaxis protein